MKYKSFPISILHFKKNDEIAMSLFLKLYLLTYTHAQFKKNPNKTKPKPTTSG